MIYLCLESMFSRLPRISDSVASAPLTARCRGFYVDESGDIGYDFICPVCGFPISDLSVTDGFCKNCKEGYHVPCNKPAVRGGIGYHQILSLFKVCIDLDGVVFNFNEAVRIVAQLIGLDFDPDKVTDYAYNCDCGLCFADIEGLLHDVNFYRIIPYRDGVIRALSRLRGCSDLILEGYSSVCVESKVDPVYRYRKRVFEDLGLSGDPILGEAKPVHYDAVAVIDDNLEIIRKWVDSGTPALLYLVDAPYNQISFKDLYDYRGVIRVPNLGVAVDDILTKAKEGVLHDISMCQSSFAYKG